MKKYIAPILALLLVGVVTYFIIPFRFSFPIEAHEHIQVQFYYNETRFDLSKPEFQVDSDPYTCSDFLSPEPMHFHDGNPEVLHIHWAGILGKDFLRYYGFISNMGEKLGYRVNTFPQLQKIRIHGDLLPKPKKSEKVWIFNQDDEGVIEQLPYTDFLKIPLSSKSSSLVAEAHGDKVHAEGKFIFLIQEHEPNIDFIFQQFQTFSPLDLASCSE